MDFFFHGVKLFVQPKNKTATRRNLCCHWFESPSAVTTTCIFASAASVIARTVLEFFERGQIQGHRQEIIHAVDARNEPAFAGSPGKDRQVAPVRPPGISFRPSAPGSRGKF